MVKVDKGTVEEDFLTVAIRVILTIRISRFCDIRNIRNSCTDAEGELLTAGQITRRTRTISNALVSTLLLIKSIRGNCTHRICGIHCRRYYRDAYKLGVSNRGLLIRSRVLNDPSLCLGIFRREKLIRCSVCLVGLDHDVIHRGVVLLLIQP